MSNFNHGKIKWGRLETILSEYYTEYDFEEFKNAIANDKRLYLLPIDLTSFVPQNLFEYVHELALANHVVDMYNSLYRK